MHAHRLLPVALLLAAAASLGAALEAPPARMERRALAPGHVRRAPAPAPTPQGFGGIFGGGNAATTTSSDTAATATSTSSSVDTSASAAAAASSSSAAAAASSSSAAAASASSASRASASSAAAASASASAASASSASAASVAASLSSAQAALLTSTNPAGQTLTLTSTVAAPEATSATATGSADSSGGGGHLPLIIGVSVVGGCAVLGALIFLWMKFGGKRFSDYQEDDADIKWPELKADGDSAAMQPLPARRTGGAGFDMGDESDLGHDGDGRSMHEYGAKGRDSFTASNVALTGAGAGMYGAGGAGMGGYDDGYAQHHPTGYYDSQYGGAYGSGPAASQHYYGAEQQAPQHSAYSESAYGDPNAASTYHHSQQPHDGYSEQHVQGAYTPGSPPQGSYGQGPGMHNPYH